ncbi:helix-turn-helix domain-containing protein [Phocaeicola sp.]
MEQDIVKISFARILETVPGLKHLENELIVTDTKGSYNLQAMPLFKYPLRLDGIVINIHPEDCTELNGYVNLRKCTLNKNQLLICAPGDIVQTEAVVKQPRVLLISSYFLQNMQINVNTFIPAIILLRENPVFDLSEKEIKELSYYYDLIEENIEQEGRFQKEIMIRLTAIFLYKIGNILNTHIEDFSTQSKNTQKRETLIFNQFINLVSEHHRTERRVDFYAERLYLSPKYFSAVIKKASGKTAGEWIDNYVILEAKSLLKYSAMSIQEIAYYMNFPNPSFFGKYFKHHTGMSPSEYKAQ